MYQSVVRFLKKAQGMLPNSSASILSYLKPFKLKLVAGMVCIFLSSASSMAFPYLLKKLIDSTQQLSANDSLSTTKIAVLLFVTLVFQTIFSFCRTYLFNTVGEKVIGKLRQDVYGRLIMMPMNFFAENRVGELSSRVSSDITLMQEAITGLFAELLRGILTVLIGILLIFYLSTQMALLMLAVVPLLVIITVLFSKMIRRIARQTQDQLAQSVVILQETLQGIFNVKSFTNEMFEMNRYQSSLAAGIQLGIRNARNRSLFSSLLIFATFSSIVIIVWFGTELVKVGRFSFGDLTAFIIYTAFVGGNFAGFAELYSHFQRTLGATHRVRELLAGEPEQKEILPANSASFESLSGRIIFENVYFSYPSRRDITVLNNISFKIEPGRKIAIVGRSGVGKSTIAALLLRFYEPTGGRIYYDEHEASSIPLHELRKKIGIVPQDVFLFGGTILENIQYGRPGCSNQEIEKAAKLALAHEFIVDFPDGYKTIVGERGVQLSGGQRQRIAIARAILKDPAILILDEATSSLDGTSERLVQQALEGLMKNRTSIIISHRLATVQNADVILVLRNGEIVETGTHTELISIEDGVYWELNHRQLSGIFD